MHKSANQMQADTASSNSNPGADMNFTSQKKSVKKHKSVKRLKCGKYCH